MSDAEAFVKASELSEKLAVLRRLDQSAKALVDFERAAQLMSASPDDLALIGSYRDLSTQESMKGLPRSDSEVYWHRATGEQDFECDADGPAACEAQTESEYWEQVTIANNPDGFSPTSARRRAADPLLPPTEVAINKSFWDTIVDNC